MTNFEKVLCSVLSDTLLCNNFSDIQAYAQKKLGRLVFTHELCDEELINQLKKFAIGDLIDICSK